MISSGFLILSGFHLQRLQKDKDFRFLFQDFHPLPQMAFVHLFFLSFLILQRIPCTFCGQEVRLVFRFQPVFHESHFAVPEFRAAVLEFSGLWIPVSLFVFQFFIFFGQLSFHFFN